MDVNFSDVWSVVSRLALTWSSCRCYYRPSSWAAVNPASIAIWTDRESSSLRCDTLKRSAVGSFVAVVATLWLVIRAAKSCCFVVFLVPAATRSVLSSTITEWEGPEDKRLVTRVGK